MAADDEPTDGSNAPTSGEGSSGSNAANSSSGRSSNFLAAAAEARQTDSSDNTESNTASPVSDSTSANSSSQGAGSSVVAVQQKLQQVRGYIQQTTAAMEGLEQQGDLGKIGQYNTLSKVLKELKTSEIKLLAHLATLQQPGNAGDSNTSDSRTTPLPNSQSIGLVSTMTVDRVDSNPVPPPTPFSDRLAAGLEEANQLTDRLRESAARREDLVERYRLTRERLAALRRQRRDLAQQERGLLLSQTTRESPYEDPIPGAAFWSLDELNSGLHDFRALFDKVAALRTAYLNKQQALEEGDRDSNVEINTKLRELETKRSQLIAVIAQIKRLRATKMREQGLEPDEEEEEPSASSAAEYDNMADNTTTDSTDAVTASISAAIMTAVSSSAPVSNSSSTLTTAVTASTAATINDVQSLVSGMTTSQPTLTSAPAEQTDASPAPPSRRGGSEAIGLNDSPVSAVLAARAEMVAAGQELALRTRHLNNLRDELANMKKLLDVTQKKAQEAEAVDNRGGPGAAAGSSSSASGPADESEPPQQQQEEEEDGGGGVVSEMAGEYVTGVGGNVIRLSNLERQDPAVIAKYKQLSEAKQRMKQMEEIMRVIQSSRGSGQLLSEILSQDQLQLLQQAQAEDGVDPTPSAPAPAAPEPVREQPLLGMESPASVSPVPRAVRSRRAGSSDSRFTPEDSMESIFKRNCCLPRGGAGGDDLSAMQQHLSKHQPQVAPVNEDARTRPSKRAVDKLECWSERSGAGAGQAVRGASEDDPRVAEIVALQEELKRKKNALEALMKGMGKASSLHPDNISDNISEGGSVPSSPLRRNRDFGSCRREMSVNDDRRVRDPDVVRQWGAAAAAPVRAPLMNNNLTGVEHQRSVRPKHNRGGGAREERRGHSDVTLSDALSQLSSMQSNINSLYETLRSEQENRSSGPAQNPALQQLRATLHKQQQHLLQLQQQQQPLNIVNTPAAALMMPGVTAHELSNLPMLSASLQQCFSQLYLHSLEIQSLNKHIQLLEQRLANEAKMQPYCLNCLTTDKSLLLHHFTNASNVYHSSNSHTEHPLISRSNHYGVSASAPPYSCHNTFPCTNASMVTGPLNVSNNFSYLNSPSNSPARPSTQYMSRDGPCRSGVPSQPPLNNANIYRSRAASSCYSPHYNPLDLTRNPLRVTVDPDGAASLEPSLDSGVAGLDTGAHDLLNNLSCDDLRNTSHQYTRRESWAPHRYSCNYHNKRCPRAPPPPASVPQNNIASNSGRTNGASGAQGIGKYDLKESRDRLNNGSSCCTYDHRSAKRRDATNLPEMGEPMQPMELLTYNTSHSLRLLQRINREDERNHRGATSLPSPPVPEMNVFDERENDNVEKFLVDLQSPDPEDILQELESEYQRLIAPLTLQHNEWTQEDAMNETIMHNNEWTEGEQDKPLPNDLLNNQVSPGVRANNYWDNFRSYTHQNMLSGNTNNIISKRNSSQATSPMVGTSPQQNRRPCRDHREPVASRPFSPVLDSMHQFNGQHMQESCETVNITPLRDVSPSVGHWDNRGSQQRYSQMLLKTQAKTSNTNKASVSGSCNSAANYSNNIKYVKRTLEEPYRLVRQADDSIDNMSNNCPDLLCVTHDSERPQADQPSQVLASAPIQHHTPLSPSGGASGPARPALQDCPTQDKQCSLPNYFLDAHMSDDKRGDTPEGEEPTLLLMLQDCNLQCPPPQQGEEVQLLESSSFIIQRQEEEETQGGLLMVAPQNHVPDYDDNILEPESRDSGL